MPYIIKRSDGMYFYSSLFGFGPNEIMAHRYKTKEAPLREIAQHKWNAKVLKVKSDGF